MVLKLLKIKNRLKDLNIFQRYGFFNPRQGSIIVRNIPPLKTKNFISFFQRAKNNQYKVIICFLAPNLRVFNTIFLSGYTLKIKRLVYAYMVNYEDNRIRR